MMTVDEIETMADELPKRIVRFCSKAPRTWDEIVGCMAGVSDPTRQTICAEEAQRVHVVTQVLWDMVKTGAMKREVSPSMDALPQYDTYMPR